MHAPCRFGPDGNVTSPRPPLLMVPGAATSITSWGMELLRALAEEQEVIIFSHRGQGYSEVPRLEAC